MMTGKVLMDRKILDWEWWSDVNTARVFFYLILVASWKDTRWHGQEIKRGTVITSLASLVAGTNLTPNEVRTAIKHLLSTGEITKQSTNRNTIIYVVNYDFYQTLSLTDNKQTTNESQPINNPLTNKPQTINKPLTTSEIYKESKEGKEGNKEIYTPLTPLTGEWNYDKHTNLENVKHLLNHESYKDADYILEHKQLWESIKTWMEYKDAKKPRSSNHYANDKSITALLNKFVENCKAHGEQAVSTAVDDTLAAGYQGIVWWKIKDTTDDWSKIV